MTTIQNNPQVTNPDLLTTQNTNEPSKTHAEKVRDPGSTHIRLNLSEAKLTPGAPLPNWTPTDIVFRNLGDIESVVDSQQFNIQQLLSVLIKFAATVAETSKNNRFDAALAAEALKLAGAEKTRDSAQLQKAAGVTKFALSGAAATVSIGGGLHGLGSVKTPTATPTTNDIPIDTPTTTPSGVDAEIPGDVTSLPGGGTPDVAVDTTPPGPDLDLSTAGQSNDVPVDVATNPNEVTTNNIEKPTTGDTPSELTPGGNTSEVSTQTDTDVPENVATQTDTDVPSEARVDNSATGETGRQEATRTEATEEDRIKEAARGFDKVESVSAQQHAQNTKLESELQIYRGISQLLQGFGELGGSQLEGTATAVQAEGQRLNALAETRQAVQQSENSYAEEWQQYQAKVFQLAEKVNDVAHQVTQRIYS